MSTHVIGHRTLTLSPSVALRATRDSIKWRTIWDVVAFRQDLSDRPDLGRVLGASFAALDRDAAAEGQLIAIAPRLSDEQILRAWAYLGHDDALRWRARSALAQEAPQRVVGRSERDGQGTAVVQRLAATLGVEPGRVYRLAQIHAVVEGGGVGTDLIEVLPEMAWYDEALAAPDPAAALGYAVFGATASRRTSLSYFPAPL